MTREARPIAVVCSDVHLWHQKPSCRGEAAADWFGVMGRYFSDLLDITKNGALPLVIAGDLFDRWYTNPELIYYAMSWFAPFEVYAIAGQHDMPNHRKTELSRSGFGVLARSGIINMLSRPTHVGSRLGSKNLMLYPFHWNDEVHPREPVENDDSYVHVAVLHAYVWERGFGHPGADPEAISTIWSRSLRGYDIAVFGDNHIAFDRPGKPHIFNCGMFMRRVRTEFERKPRVGMIYDDGTIRSVDLTSADADVLQSESMAVVTSEIDELFGAEDLDMDSIDFRERLTRAVAHSPEPVKVEVASILEEAQR